MIGTMPFFFFKPCRNQEFVFAFFGGDDATFGARSES
jgi:hypothetical protein